MHKDKDETYKFIPSAIDSVWKASILQNEYFLYKLLYKIQTVALTCHNRVSQQQPDFRRRHMETMEIVE